MTRLTEQYVRIPRRLLESPVLQVLNANEWRALRRILIEHQQHSGFVNGGLVVTTSDFEAAGVQRKHVGHTWRVLEALGIIQCTRCMQGTSSGRLPNCYRPTFLPTTPRANDATHEYTRFKTVAEARLAAEAARIHDPRDKSRLIDHPRRPTQTARTAAPVSGETPCPPPRKASRPSRPPWPKSPS
jgi:hypothetical protein